MREDKIRQGDIPFSIDTDEMPLQDQCACAPPLDRFLFENALAGHGIANAVPMVHRGQLLARECILERPSTDDLAAILVGRFGTVVSIGADGPDGP